MNFSVTLLSVSNLNAMKSRYSKFSVVVKSRNTRIAMPLILFAIAFFALVFSSCEPEDLEARNKFIGRWIVSETSSHYGGPPMSFTVNIKASPDDPDEIIISNFYNMNVDAYAYVTGNNVTIPRQLICDDTIEVQGSGSYQSNGEVHLNYTTNDGAVEDNLTAILKKQ